MKPRMETVQGADDCRRLKRGANYRHYVARNGRKISSYRCAEAVDAPAVRTPSKDHETEAQGSLRACSFEK